jgi:hypothetical protein
MPSLVNTADPPLQDAILAWEAAVVAADRETFRVANGGAADPARAAELLTAVELARRRCEQLATDFDRRSERPD